VIGIAMSAFVSIIPVTGMVKAADKSSTKRDESSLEYRGFVQNVYHSDAEEEYQWRAARVNLKYHFDPVYTFGSELELVGAGESGSNWLREFWLQRNIGDWNIQAGRIFLSAGGSTIPPYKLKTVNGPYSPYNFYGWGGKVHGKIANNVSASFDITGQTGMPFDSSDNGRGIETSGRVKFTFNGWSVNPAWQLGENFARVSVDAAVLINPELQLSGLVYGAKNDNESEKGGHALLSWQPKNSFELHTQLKGKDDGKTILTNGLNLFFGKGFSVTVDHEKALNQDHSDSMWGRLQVVF
jgi:opacity protein-like surface antigen